MPLRTGPGKRPVASLLLQRGRSHRTYFYRGLERLGYAILDGEAQDHPEPDDLLVIWNRLPTIEHIARKYEEIGAKVVVAEHAWVGNPEQLFALSLGNHNGAGTWRVGDVSRWPSFGIEVKPWRAKGTHILVVPQRGIGVPPAAMPRGWPSDVMGRLSQVTGRLIVLRPPQDRVHPFEDALRDVHAVVTWASGAGVKALINGIPVFYEMPKWIGRWAAMPGIASIENPYLGERDTFLRYLSWAMWKAEEIESGEALAWLLQS